MKYWFKVKGVHDEGFCSISTAPDYSRLPEYGKTAFLLCMTEL